MLLALSSGILLGLSCGLAPGPLLALVLAQTLRHGPREGCKVAWAPLLTDVPIILVALVAASELSRRNWALGFLSVCGGLFVLYLAYDTFRPQPLNLAAAEIHPRSWLKGAVVNILNPQPWLFWMTVGAATLSNAWAAGIPAVVAFVSGFYFCLVGSKVALALVSGRFCQFLSGRLYRTIMVVFAILLVGFAFLLLREGIIQLAR
jgi:threonine/homoserine/homoserine lactone efflux protein